jgi:hypothetical protein
LYQLGINYEIFLTHPSTATVFHNNNCSLSSYFPFLDDHDLSQQLAMEDIDYLQPSITYIFSVL